MAKRQKRIPGHEIISRSTEIQDKPVTLVLRGGEVFFVQITQISSNAIFVVDQKNGKRELALENIQEVIVDFRENYYAETSAN